MKRDEYLLKARAMAARGQDAPMSKLTDIDVIDIRSSVRQRRALMDHINAKLSNKALCKLYGIHERTLEKIISCETWTHLP